ncbi:MAG: hypothetical protein EBT03_11585 [Betaproteobacteria bacterium]|nr:hypothetical protein [Betaproteobacteria bacterium]NCA17692.1 hypothetical protein [Betaproteobacteria bacterium]
MGGISDGRFRITPDKTLEFFGTLSLENSGGFASPDPGRTRLSGSISLADFDLTGADRRMYSRDVEK